MSRRSQRLVVVGYCTQESTHPSLGLCHSLPKPNPHNHHRRAQGKERRPPPRLLRVRDGASGGGSEDDTGRSSKRSSSSSSSSSSSGRRLLDQSGGAPAARGPGHGAAADRGGGWALWQQEGGAGPAPAAPQVWVRAPRARAVVGLLLDTPMVEGGLATYHPMYTCYTHATRSGGGGGDSTIDKALARQKQLYSLFAGGAWAPKNKRPNHQSPYHTIPYQTHQPLPLTWLVSTKKT